MDQSDHPAALLTHVATAEPSVWEKGVSKARLHDSLLQIAALWKTNFMLRPLSRSSARLHRRASMMSLARLLGKGTDRLCVQAST